MVRIGISLLCGSGVWHTTNLGSEPLAAQSIQRQGTPIKAEHAALATAGTLVLSLLDQPVQRFVQDHRSEIGDHIAHAFRQLGEVDVIAPGILAITAAGLVTDNTPLERSGVQLTASVGLAALLTVAGKFIVGRERPRQPDSSGAWRFEPFTDVFDKAFPSGHTAVAFAVATTLADISTSNVTRGFIYLAAAGTAWSRVNDNRHWLSDVGFGAVVGLTASKLTTGHWTVFGIDSPEYLRTEDPNRTNVGELALSAAAGIGVFHLARLTNTTMSFTPLATRLGNGALGLGAVTRF